MTRLLKTLTLAAAVCLSVAPTETMAQFRGFSRGKTGSSLKGSINKARSNTKSSTSRGLGSVKSSIGKSSIGKSSIGKSSGLSNSVKSKFGSRFSGSKGKIGLGQSSGLSKVLPGRANPIKTLPGKTLPGWKLPGKGVTGTLPGKTPPMKTLPFNPGGKGKINIPFPGKGVPAIGGGNGNKVGKAVISNNKWKELVGHIVEHKLHHLHKDHWCHSRPATCHWWAGYCRPIANCHYHDLLICDWSRVHCATTIHVGTAPQDVQWYLGLKGILLPGRGLGVEAVEAGSPAELVGLQPGMVMTACNGIELVDETSMQEAIRISGGVLQMTLLSADGTQVLQGTVQMARVAAVSF